MRPDPAVERSPIVADDRGRPSRDRDLRPGDAEQVRKTAAAEFRSADLALRALDGSVVPVNTDTEYNYKWGLRRFLEARQYSDPR